jgi:hypothetical protein
MAQLFKLKYIKYKNKYNMLKKELDEVDLNQTDLNQTDLDLTDTPSKEGQVGGTAPVSFTPNMPCPGVVNPMPSVLVPMNQDGGSCAGIVNPQPVISPPVSLSTIPPMASMKNDLVDSDVNNTEDIERLFKQIGGKKHHTPSKASKSSESSLFDSESSSLFGSDFDEALSLCDD